jgi:hypothetical protein
MLSCFRIGMTFSASKTQKTHDNTTLHSIYRRPRYLLWQGTSVVAIADSTGYSNTAAWGTLGAVKSSLLLEPESYINCIEPVPIKYAFDLMFLTCTESRSHVAARSEVWTVFVRSNTGVVGSNPTWEMDVSVRLFCICVVLCIGRGLATGWSPAQGVLPNVYRIKKLKSGQGPTIEP